MKTLEPTIEVGGEWWHGIGIPFRGDPRFGEDEVMLMRNDSDETRIVPISVLPEECQRQARRGFARRDGGM